MSKIPSPHFQTSYCFFNFLFDKFWNSIYLTYTKVWIRGFGWQFFYFFIPKRVALCSECFFLNFLLNYELFCPNRSYQDRITKMQPKYLNGKLWPYQLSCFIISFLHDPVNTTWFFKNFIFELEASYSFKITCILVRQLIPLTKNVGVIGKIYCLISWSPICTPLILVSASVKMAGTSATVM